MVIYIISDGKKGHLSQTRGLAGALLERARRLRPQAQHSCHEVDITRKGYFAKLFYKGKDLAELPAPDLILCAGHGTHLAALSLARHKRCLCMVCMRPSLPLGLFDLCIMPRHDVPANREPGANTFCTNGAINCIHPRPDIPKTETLILVGGPSKSFSWDAELLLTQLANIVRHNNTPMVLTTSRRTPPDFLQDLQAACPSIHAVPVEETSADWVPLHLSRASEVWVTQDSVSMVYEALSSGAPVGILEMAPPREDAKSRKKRVSRVERGLHMLVKDGMVHTFTEWARDHRLPAQGEVINEAGRAADYILERFPRLLP